MPPFISGQNLFFGGKKGKQWPNSGKRGGGIIPQGDVRGGDKNASRNQKKKGFGGGLGGREKPLVNSMYHHKKRKRVFSSTRGGGVADKGKTKKRDH